MEKELNIAAILKDKSYNLKLYDIARETKVFYNCQVGDSCEIHCDLDKGGFLAYNYNGTLLDFPKGMQILKPSKEMQDWSKFAWKKGDVLVYIYEGEPRYTVFEAFQDDEYTVFKSRYYYSEGNPWLQLNSRSLTNNFAKASDEEAKKFIKKIEETYGGKLNLETLQIEKPEPKPKQEFKDGDIVTLEGSGSYAKCVIIFKNNNPQVISNDIHYHALLNIERMQMGFDNCVYNRENPRPATDSEKQQLYDALAKKNKVWNPDTLQIEYLPKKCEFKAFDKVLVRDTDAGIWMPTLFGFYDKEFNNFVCLNDVFQKCIPYNEETAHLLGTTDEWEGGEG